MDQFQFTQQMPAVRGLSPYNLMYLLVLVSAILCMAASAAVTSTYKKYAEVMSKSGMTGAQAAQRILDLNGVTDVKITQVAGSLTDHYDPAAKVVRLSQATYNSASVAAVGVAAHECGHVMQHHNGYIPLKIRTALVPAAQIGSKAGLPLIFIGLMLGLNNSLAKAGVLLFLFSVLFQVLTLPVEFDASARALKLLQSGFILDEEETAKSRKVLTAAAMTYVASAASAVIQLLRLMMIVGGGSRRRD